MRYRKIIIVFSILALLNACIGSAVDSTQEPGDSKPPNNSSENKQPPELELIYAINSGGQALTDKNGTEFSADNFFNGGSVYSSNDDIADSDSDALYQTERFGNYNYSLPVEQGEKYKIVLFFAEIFHSGRNQRTFNLYINNKLVLENFDVFDEVGHDTAKNITIEDLVADGKTLSIKLENVVDNAKLSAFTVHKLARSSLAKGRELYKEQCSDCHGNDGGGKLIYPALYLPACKSCTDLKSLSEKIASSMPVVGEKCSGTCADSVATYILETFSDKPLVTYGSADPGYKPIHRLNAYEYSRTISGLTGIEKDFSKEFLPDAGGTFDNDAKALVLSPTQVSLYHSAADSVINENNNSLVLNLANCEINDKACYSERVSEMATKVWRRPATREEISTMVEDFRDSLLNLNVDKMELAKATVKRLLLSPNFIFRSEQLQVPESAEAEKLNNYELVTRLSYFLWSRGPDDSLLDLAAQNSPIGNEQLSEQVDRMLKHEASSSLVDSFAEQWLLIRKLRAKNMDTRVFPEWGDTLKFEMEQGLKGYFSKFLNSEISMEEFLTAPVTPDVLPTSIPYSTASARLGILGMPGFLLATSETNRTSLVLRGSHVLSDFLCEEPPPPPPGVEGLAPKEGQPKTERERLEAHRANPDCAVCHDAIDPIGFGLEEFDALGRYRTVNPEGLDIDAFGELPSGETFNGLSEMAGVLQNDPRFYHCVTEKLTTYALGRDLETKDHIFVDKITESWLAGQPSLSSLIKEIVTSRVFQYHRGIDLSESANR